MMDEHGGLVEILRVPRHWLSARAIRLLAREDEHAEHEWAIATAINTFAELPEDEQSRLFADTGYSSQRRMRVKGEKTFASARRRGDMEAMKHLSRLLSDTERRERAWVTTRRPEWGPPHFFP